MPDVTPVTAHPISADDLTPEQYREIYDELRSKCALRPFVEFLRSGVSIAWWSKYERGDTTLDHDRRNELRAAVGLPLLPPTVAAALTAVDPDATVYRVGHRTPDRVIMVGADMTATLTMRLNGDLHVSTDVTPVTSPPRRAPRKNIHLSIPAWERLNTARTAAGLSWEDFLSKLAG